MTALLVAGGWKILAVLGALLAAGLMWWRSLATAKAGGVAQQQASDARKQEADIAKANVATGGVSELDDVAALRELHAQYDRKPVPVGKGDLGLPR